VTTTRSSTDFKTTQSFLDKNYKASNEELQTALGLSQNELAVFLLALTGVSEASGLAIQDLNKSTRDAETHYASVTCNNLKKKGFLAKGKRRGQWSITEHALDAMAKVLSGQMDALVKKKTANKMRKVPGKIKKRPKAGPKKGSKIKSQFDIDGMSLREIMVKLENLDKEIADLSAQREQLRNACRVFFKRFDD
jgi:hypothetical protein